MSLEGLAPQVEGRRRTQRTGAGEQAERGTAMPPQRLLREAGLPEAGIPDENHTAELPGARSLPFGVESGEFGLAPDERRLPRHETVSPLAARAQGYYDPAEPAP